MGLTCNKMCNAFKPEALGCREPSSDADKSRSYWKSKFYDKTASSAVGSLAS